MARGLQAGGMRAALALLNGDDWNEKIKRALFQEAHELRSVMVQSFRLQKGGGVKRWAPLSQATIALRRSVERKATGGRVRGKKALIATGQMRKAILVAPSRVNSVLKRGGADPIFVGIPRGVRRKPSGDMINLALVHEFGAVMRPTLKQSRWFWAAISKANNPAARRILKDQKKRRREGGSKGISLLIIPPRPFITPSVEKWQEGFNTRMAVKMLGGG